MDCLDVKLCEKIDTLILSSDNFQTDFANVYFPEIQMISFVLQFSLIISVFILFLVWIYKLIKKFEF